ncbi:MAG: glycosyltransferase family 39 protein [Bacteroidota bacterium]
MAILFVFGIWPALSYPLYWDELGVYGPGVLHLVDQGIGLLPSAMPPELSRGHPLGFYALAATWISVSGWSLFSFHLFALVITLGLGWALFSLCRQQMSDVAALLCSTAFLMMPAIRAQATLVLPEMFLAACTLLALHAFYQQKWGPYILWTVIAMQVKETAILIPLAALTYILFAVRRYRWKAWGFTLLPILSLLLFFGIQRMQHGWFFFPYHMELITWSWAGIWAKFLKGLYFITLDQGRGMISAMMLVAFFLYLYRREGKWKEMRTSFGFLLLIYGGGLLAFSSLNVYMDRYLLSALGILAIFWGWSLDVYGKGESFWKWGFLFVPLLFLFWPNKQAFHYDVDPNYADAVLVQQKAAAYLEHELTAGDTLYTNFPLYGAMLDPRYGYVQDTVAFQMVTRYDTNLQWAATCLPPHWGEDVQPKGELRKALIQGQARVKIYVKE